MESKFQTLPPLKRFRLMQQQEELGHKKGDVSFHLPAKKRKGSRATIAEPTTYCLPAKKRVWAFPPPTLSPIKNSCPFDLNLEYSPFSGEDEQDKDQRKSPDGSTDSESIEIMRGKEFQDGEEEDGRSLSGYGDGQSIESSKEEKDESGGEETDDGIECAICQSTDGDPSDPIVICDGCDLMVHATCMGNPLIHGIPEGNWFCPQCSVSQSEKNKNEVLSCCLCPVKGGALKRTNNGRWAHVICALLVPEVFFHDPEGRDGIDFSKLPTWRWERVCYLCKTANGCAIDCSEPKCPLAFHVTCGLNKDLCIEYKQVKKNKSAIVAGFCKNHTELWRKQQETGKFRIVAREENKR